jgi:2',3'-cyclic-nucleotide 2'-phosphodiesterase (5'-nucleotidase family)
VARFATRIRALKAANPMHAVVSAGDMIGASPLTSALFKDEPTIEAMNRIGIDFNAVGNHEFDEGKDELLRMQQGGNHPSDLYTGLGLPQDLRDGRFAGARFGFLAANVVDTATGATLLPGVGVKDFLGHKLAFVGMTLEATPTIVSSSGGPYARNLSDIDLTIDTRTSDVVAVSATNLVTGTDTPEDPALTELVAHYDALSIGPKSRVIGRISAP